MSVNTQRPVTLTERIVFGAVLAGAFFVPTFYSSVRQREIDHTLGVVDRAEITIDLSDIDALRGKLPEDKLRELAIATLRRAAQDIEKREAPFKGKMTMPLRKGVEECYRVSAPAPR